MRYVTLTAFIVAALTTSAARCEDWTESRRADLVAAGLKYGLTTVRAVAVSMETALPPPIAAVNPDQRRALEKVLEGYVHQRQSAQGTMMALQGGVEFLIDGSAATMAATGVGLVPAAVFKTTAQISSDALFSGMQEDINQNLALYLKKLEPQLMTIAGGNYDTLRGESPEALKAKLQQQSTIFAEVNNIVGDDPIARERAQGMVIQAIRGTSQATLDLIDQHDQRLNGIETRIGTLANSIAKFEKRTVAVLQQHEEALLALRDDMSAMQEAVSAIDGRLKVQERNASFVNDLVFDSMPAGAKATALKGGFLAERFVCPPSNPTCGGAELKADLIKRFEAEARIAAHVEAVKTTVTALNNVASIATDIGLNIPALNEAAQYGSAAANAFASFASGNYLGAIASVTGVLRKRSDPDAERFKVLMTYLQEQFREINVKLDAVLANQQRMMEALEKLSEQMRTYYVALDERLLRMEFELKRVRDIGLATLWRPWEACESVYNHLARNEAKYHYLALGDFARIDDLYAAIHTVGQPASTCVRLGQDRTISITSPHWFGNFLDARLVRNETPDPLPPDEMARGEILTRNQLDVFINSVHAPSRALVIDLFDRYGLPADRGVELLISPGYLVRTIRNRLRQKPAGSPCGAKGYLQERVQRLLCGQDNSGAKAIELISTPMSVDGALKVTEWLLVASRFADLIDQENGTFVSQSDMLTYAGRTAESISPGQDILEKTQSMLDAAVSGYSVLYGDLTARAIVDALFDSPPASKEAVKRKADLAQVALLILKKNPYLAHNVVQILLHDRYGTRHGDTERAKPSALMYRAAYEYALNKSEDPGFLLRSIFGNDLKFETDPASNRVMLNLAGVAVEDRTVLVPLAEPKSFVEGRLIYPARMTRLIEARTRVAERLADYRALTGLTAQERRALVWAVARAEKLNPTKPDVASKLAP